ncbi:MAG TPA: hypothetical protein VHV77_04225, partial [Pirellulales bacterium]|nr:hypothetical protein [Pirellulales bacterium]
MASVVLVSTGLAAWAASRFLSYLEVIGEATGVEFSPDVFKHRSFRYWTAAGFALPGTRRTYEWSSDLDTYLNTNGFVLAPPNRPTHWEFVRGFHPGRRGWMGG